MSYIKNHGYTKESSWTVAAHKLRQCIGADQLMCLDQLTQLKRQPGTDVAGVRHLSRRALAGLHENKLVAQADGSVCSVVQALRPGQTELDSQLKLHSARTFCGAGAGH